MAVRKAKGKSHRNRAPVVFWLVFIIVIVGIFLVNRNAIQKNFNLFTQRMSAHPDKTEEEIDESSEDEEPDILIVQMPVNRESPDRRSSDQRSEEQTSSDQRSEDPRSENLRFDAVPQTAVQERPPAPQSRPREQTPLPTETRDRNLYFTRVDNDGQILRSSVTRKIAVSPSPLNDVLNALLAGPNAEERGRGNRTLIPPNTRLLSAIVRGSTAYISFNEDFLYNSYGVEGYAAGLRQIVWTATEFPTVNDVQILIEGRRTDYLGEGIWIGSPINRQSF